MKIKLGSIKNKTALIVAFFLLIPFGKNLFAVNNTFSLYSYNYSFNLMNSYMILPYNFAFLQQLSLQPNNMYADTLNTDRSNLLFRPSMEYDPFYKYVFGKKTDDAPGVISEQKIDTSAQNITSVKKYDDVELNYKYDVELDDYLKFKKDNIQKNLWDSLVTTYDTKKAMSQGDLARMVAQSTGFSIPIPPNPVTDIFGKPEVAINVNGEVNVRIGWRWDSQDLGTVSQFGQTQSSPIFDQDIRVNVSGRIGDKLKLGTDWNTRRSFDHDNTFKVGYEGEDDEIIKKVEVGNVNLPLPTQLITGGQTLFGIRSDYQFGPLYLKTIFSQKRGQRKFVDVKGGASRKKFAIRAYDFAPNHFFIDTVYKRIYDEYFQYSTPVLPKSGAPHRIKQIEVWESTNDVREAARVSANSIAIADLPPIPDNSFYPSSVKQTPTRTGFVEKGNFVRIDSNKYDFDYNLGTLSIKNLRQDRFYAVSYRVEGPTPSPDDDIRFGTFAKHVGERDTFILKLVYVPNMTPRYSTLWDRRMKNIYDIGATNVNINETKINIWYIRQSNDSTDVLEGVPDKLVTIFGVDQVNNSSGAAPPDGVFDLSPPFFKARTGEITFPSSEPFGDGLREYFSSPEVGNPELAELYAYDDVYDTTYEAATRNTAKDRFIISGEVSGQQSNRISLGAFNLSPGSVRVTLNGVELREYQDYVVDYFAGTLELRNQRATLPNANLKIEYEQQDIFNISTRTLAGIRADYKLFKTRYTNANLGATVMHYDQSALIDRVRLGDEPVSNTMFGVDGRINMKLPWLTKVMDALPFYDTKAESSMDMKGEWAMILPTPNKRKSTITSDNGEPVVYIDDFEGAQRYISLGLNPSQWIHSAPPINTNLWPNDTNASLFRAKLWWWQYFIPRIPIREVYPNNESYQQGRSNISPLYVSFDTKRRGIYNRNTEFLDEANPEYSGVPYSSNPEIKEKIWGGMTRLLSSFNTNFDNENIEYIEVMMKMSSEPTAKMYIDIGQISEDIIPNGRVNTEDGITEGSKIVNNLIDTGEDVGLDGMTNAQERGEEEVPEYTAQHAEDPYPYPLNLEDDPARDDYAFDFGKDDNDRDIEDFFNYNNFEGNATVSELGQFPDTEILNKNSGQNVYLDNNYFTYEVNLLPDAEQNPQIIGGNPDAGWYLYRIPVRKPDSKTGDPQFSNIQYIRVRWQGGDFVGMIADWRLVGSQWQRVSNFQSNVSDDDSLLQIAFVNLWENAGPPDFYTMPPGVTAPRRLNNPDPRSDIRENEQSIAINVKNLPQGEERMAVRIFRPLDVFYYKKLKFFIHGDGSMPADDKSSVKAYAFVRFGIDSANYYEYRVPLLRGWQDIEVDLSELTAVKQIRDSANMYNRRVFPVPGDPKASFAIKGNPILTRVRFFGLGISNPSKSFQELSTTMWVNELRLISPEASADWAGLSSATVQFADLGSINASVQKQQPNFHMLEERFGDRISSTNWSVNMQGNLEKFAPKSFKQMRLPVSYSHSEYMDTPDYVANNDINLEEAANAAYNKAIENGATPDEAESIRNETIKRSQTLIVEDSWAITGVKLGIPLKHWLVDYTFNALTLGYSYNQEFQRTPVYENKFQWSWRLDTKYNIKLPDILTFQPLGFLESVPLLNAYKDVKYNFLPTNFNAGVVMSRRRQTEQSRFLDFPSPVIRDFTAQRQASFQWKFSENGFLSPNLDYNFSTNSTLIPLELNENGEQRTGSEIADLMFFNDGNFIDFGKNNLHSQTIGINLTPTLPNIFNIHQFVDLTGVYNVTYNWRDPMQSNPEIRDIAKNASYNATLRFNASIRLKAAGENWFGTGDKKNIPRRGPGARTPPTQKPDTTETDAAGKSIGRRIGLVFKTIFLDWEKLDIGFNQTNSSINPGVYGGNGMSNFWGRGITGRESELLLGPSFAYQLGLVTNPHGDVDITSGNGFPYFGFNTNIGLRPPNGIMQDNFKQSNSLDMKTSRPLWEGATLDMTWKTELGFNKNQTVETDEFGIPTFSNIMATESFNRTFLTFPSIFGFNLFGNNIENVVELFNEEKAIIEASDADSLRKNSLLLQALSNSFYEGLEAFSLTSGRTGKFLPSMNWMIRWEGLEKFYLWDEYVTRLTFEHAYTSTYQENVQITDQGRDVQNQVIQYGFQPLLGFNATFDEEKLKGQLTASLRWSNTKSYNLTSSNRATISAQTTNEITAQASYALDGFEFPLFGLSLKNQLEYSFLFTLKSNRRATYNVLEPDTYEGDDNEGTTLDGNTQLIVEPRVRYALSNIVTASVFVRYEGTFTEGASQPGYHTTQFGLDIRISITGGR